MPNESDVMEPRVHQDQEPGRPVRLLSRHLEDVDPEHRAKDEHDWYQEDHQAEHEEQDRAECRRESSSAVTDRRPDCR